MSASCLLSSKVGDVLLYIGGLNYRHKVVAKHYLDLTWGFPAGHYPVVVDDGGIPRVVHPHFYSVVKIIKHS